MHLTGESAVRAPAEQTRPSTYVIFDLLYLDGHSLMGLPYAERRERWRSSGSTASAGSTPALPRRRRRGAARGDRASRGWRASWPSGSTRAYEPGRRSGAWLKVKNARAPGARDRRLAAGRGAPRASRIGALLRRLPTTDGDAALRRQGRHRLRRAPSSSALAELLAPLARDELAVRRPAASRRKGAHFVEPELVAEVEFREWTRAGHAAPRRPTRACARTRTPREVVARAATRPPPRAIGSGRQRRRRARAARSRGGVEVELEGRELELSNLDKVLYPQAGFTKGEVIDYYARDRAGRCCRTCATAR